MSLPCSTPQQGQVYSLRARLFRSLGQITTGGATIEIIQKYIEN